MTTLPTIAAVALLAAALPVPLAPPMLPMLPEASPSAVVDTDGDGLSDFQERHKYGTDPLAADSDADGIHDGDWDERREYAYTVRSVVQVLPPVTLDVCRDDYQDARVLDVTDRYVELEVISYPLNTVASTIAPDPDWRRSVVPLAAWTEPGPTANWDPAMRDELLRQLAADGIDADSMDDVTLVQKAAHWLLGHARYEDGFTTFCTRFVDGVPEVHPALRDSGRNQATGERVDIEAAWDRELFARGMFANGVRGSCTSSAIYLNGCLRALGIPTRIVLAIPVIDASDEREVALVRHIRHHGVRAAIEEGTAGLGRSWASHTFNEVFVGGRWRRLNYGRLGQNTLDPQFFGLLTHIATFSDWADGNMAATWGVRQHQPPFDDPFGGSNPYSTIALSDRFGAHASIDNPPAARTYEQPMTDRASSEAAPVVPAQGPATDELTLGPAWWSDAPDSPVGPIPELGTELGTVILVRMGPCEAFDEQKRFTELADRRFFLEAPGAPGAPKLSVGAMTGGITSGDSSYLVVQLGPGDWRDLRSGVEYELRPRNASDSHRWRIEQPIRLGRE